MDYSWPVFYHMHIKGDLPRVMIAGRGIRINLGLVNELEMFRGEDISAECPIPICATAIPVEDDVTGVPRQKYTFEVEVISRHVRVKPFIFRKGLGTILIKIKVAPVPIPAQGLPVILQFGISPKSRIFPWVVPACTHPLLIVAADSQIATDIYKGEQADYDDDRDYGDDDGEDETEGDAEAEEAENEDPEAEAALERILSRPSKGRAGAGTGPEGKPSSASSSAAAAGEGSDDDEDDGFVDDEDEDDFDDDDDDDEIPDEEEEEGEEGEGGEERRQVKGRWAADGEGEEGGEGKADGDEDEDDDDDDAASQVSCVEDTSAPGTYHSLVADSMLTAPLPLVARAPLAASLAVLQGGGGDASSASSSAATAAAAAAGGTAAGRQANVSLGSAVSAGRAPGVAIAQVHGMQFRKPKELPPALLKKMQMQQAAAAAAAGPAGLSAAEAAAVSGAAGEAKTKEIGPDTALTPRFPLLDPLTGLIWSYRSELGAGLAGSAAAAAGLTLDQLQHVNHCYIKEVSGAELGGRVWDGALYMTRVFRRIIAHNPLFLDHLRVLELGSGTGALGLWLWQMCNQRAVGQRQRIAQELGCSVPPKPTAVVAEVKAQLEALIAIPSEAASSATSSVASSARTAAASSPPSAAAECARVYAAYGLRPSSVTLTDQKGVLPILRENAFMNFLNTPDMWLTSLRNARNITDEGERQAIRQSAFRFRWRSPLAHFALMPSPQSPTQHSHFSLPLSPSFPPPCPAALAASPQRSPAGASVLDLTWGKPLSASVLRRLGVDIALFDAPALPAPAAAAAAAASQGTAHPLFESLRKSLRSAVRAHPRIAASTSPLLPIPAGSAGATGKAARGNLSTRKQQQQQATALLQTPAQAAAPAPVLFPTQQDIVVGCDCLYNDRHYAALVETLERIITASAYAHAQQDEYLQARARLAQALSPASSALLPEFPLRAKTFPLILISYPFRTMDDEERITEGFLKPLRAKGIHSLTVPLTALLEDPAGPAEPRGKLLSAGKDVYSAGEAVYQRRVDRAKREAEIPNRVADAAKNREGITHVTLLFTVPSTSLPTTSMPDDPKTAAEWIAAIDPVIGQPSPLPLLSPSAAWLYKLFRALHVQVKERDKATTSAGAGA